MARSHTWQALRLVVGVSPTINIGGAMNKGDDIVSRSASPNGGTLFGGDEQVY